MKKIELKFVAELLIPFIAGSVAVLAVLSDTKWFVAGRISTLGIVALSLAACAFIASILLAFANRKKAYTEKTERRAIEKLAHQEIRESIHRMIWPLIHVMGEIYWVLKQPKGQAITIRRPADFLGAEAEARFASFSLYWDSNNSAYEGTKFHGTWGGLIYNAAQEGRRDLKEALSIYVGFLKPNLLHLVFLLPQSTFLKRLAEADRFMEWNPRHADADGDILNFMHGPSEHEYQNFFALMQSIFDLLEWDKEKFGAEPLQIEYYERSIGLTLRSTGPAQKTAQAG